MHSEVELKCLNSRPWSTAKTFLGEENLQSAQIDSIKFASAISEQLVGVAVVDGEEKTIFLSRCLSNLVGLNRWILLN